MLLRLDLFGLSGSRAHLGQRSRVHPGVEVEPVADGDFAVCMLWFVASYTRIVPKLLLSGLTLVIALAIVAALTQPQGLQFDSITGLSRGTLPWGEAYTRAEGRISWVFKLGLLALFTFIYMIYATASVVRRNRAATTSACCLPLSSTSCVTPKAPGPGERHRFPAAGALWRPGVHSRHEHGLESAAQRRAQGRSAGDRRGAQAARDHPEDGQ
jgi:hypothetical protein